MDHVTMCIADVNFRIQKEMNTDIKELELPYQPFFATSSPHPEAIHIDVTIEIEKRPDYSQAEKIFDTRQSWAMYKEGNIYWLVLHPPKHQKPFWIARFDLTDIIIYGAQNLLIKKSDHRMMPNPLHYPMDQLLLMLILGRHNGIILHAAGIKMVDRTVLFPGKSGAGKSTLVRQFLDNSNTTLFSDDRMVIRRLKHGFWSYGTPWPGEAGIAENDGQKLSALLFLNHGTANRIEKLCPAEAMEKLFHVASIPWFDKEILPEVLNFCYQLTTEVPCYNLFFYPDIRIVDFLRRFF